MMTIEICCGSYYDALQAWKGGAGRIELNSGLHLGGLTPSVASLELVKAHTGLKVIAMVRPRGGGFFYQKEEYLQMQEECRQLLAHGADGIAFGFLKEDGTIDEDRTRTFISMIHEAGREAVFHRAYDCVKDPFGSMEQLIALGADRVLTSGLKAKAMDGAALLKQLQEAYGDQIEILAGSGVNASNARTLMEQTGISQVHSSCKDWITDPTTSAGDVSYSFAAAPNENCYDIVSGELVKMLVDGLKE